MAAITISRWSNTDPNNKDMQELEIILSAIIDYLNKLDARLTAGGL